MLFGKRLQTTLVYTINIFLTIKGWMRLAFSMRTKDDFDINIIFDNYPDGEGTGGQHTVCSYVIFIFDRKPSLFQTLIALLAPSNQFKL